MIHCNHGPKRELLNINWAYQDGNHVLSAYTIEIGERTLKRETYNLQTEKKYLTHQSRVLSLLQDLSAKTRPPSKNCRLELAATF